MTNVQIILIETLLFASAGCLVVPLAVCLVRRVAVKPSWEGGRESGLSHLLIFSGCLIASVWCLRFAVGYFGICCPELSTIAPDTDFEGLTWWEELMNSFVHALQTFSMDEDYTEYIISGKTMLRELFGVGTVWQNVYGAYASVLNLVAPVAGGAVVFDILASISPRVRLCIYRKAIWKEKCYFSELNEYSLALAKSIVAVYGLSIRRPVIVFTDAYVDDEDEKSSEELNEAKKLGAICLKDDLSHVKKNRFGKKQIFLIDKEEMGNLQTLTSFANPYNCKSIKNSQIYLFVNDDAYVQVERNVCEKLKTYWKMEGVEDEKLPINIIPVKSYRNMISNLLVDYPLYEPLIGKKNDGERSLTVTILGTGHIGIEMFLSTYWFGQILDCRLTIQLVSQETEEEFWNKIDCINPEIRHTTIAGDPILRKNRQGQTAEPYCTVDYRECDVYTSKFIESLHPGEGSILNTDYFLVALGSDEENISVANTVRRYVAEDRIALAKKKETSEDRVAQAKTKEKTEEQMPGKSEEAQKKEESGKRDIIMIAYVVYNTALADTLNQQMKFSYSNHTEIYMRAIGSLKEVYSERNVFLNEHEASARSIHESYLTAQRKKEIEKLKERITDDYKYWANVARDCHVKYKMFSMGVIEEPWIDLGEEERRKREQETYEKCKKMISANTGEMSEKEKEEFMTLMHRMAWLEHRRWNAFTRVMGYRGTRDYSVYAEPGKVGSYKEMKIKLHPCLVECDQQGIRTRRKSDGTLEKLTMLKNAAGEHLALPGGKDYDLLDELSWDMIEKQFNDYDVKEFDYPDEDFKLDREAQKRFTDYVVGG